MSNKKSDTREETFSFVRHMVVNVWGKNRKTLHDYLTLPHNMAQEVRKFCPDIFDSCVTRISVNEFRLSREGACEMYDRIKRF